MLVYYDIAALWTGRIILGIAIASAIISITFFSYQHFFLMPHCPKCRSRKIAIAINNRGGGIHCGNCETYYWWKESWWGGKALLKDPFSREERLKKIPS